MHLICHILYSNHLIFNLYMCILASLRTLRYDLINGPSFYDEGVREANALVPRHVAELLEVGNVQCVRA
jgi:hypothetical protein